MILDLYLDTLIIGKNALCKVYLINNYCKRNNKISWKKLFLDKKSKNTTTTATQTIKHKKFLKIIVGA